MLEGRRSILSDSGSSGALRAMRGGAPAKEVWHRRYAIASLIPQDLINPHAKADRAPLQARFSVSPLSDETGRANGCASASCFATGSRSRSASARGTRCCASGRNDWMRTAWLSNAWPWTASRLNAMPACAGSWRRAVPAWRRRQLASGASRDPAESPCRAFRHHGEYRERAYRGPCRGPWRPNRRPCEARSAPSARSRGPCSGA